MDRSHTALAVKSGFTGAAIHSLDREPGPEPPLRLWLGMDLRFTASFVSLRMCLVSSLPESHRCAEQVRGDLAPRARLSRQSGQLSGKPQAARVSRQANSRSERDFEVNPRPRGGFDGRSLGSSASRINPASIKTATAMFMRECSFQTLLLHAPLHGTRPTLVHMPASSPNPRGPSRARHGCLFRARPMLAAGEQHRPKFYNGPRWLYSSTCFAAPVLSNACRSRHWWSTSACGLTEYTPR